MMMEGSPEFRREVQCLSALNLLDFPFPGAAFSIPEIQRKAAKEEGKYSRPFPGEPRALVALHFAVEISQYIYYYNAFFWYR